MNKKDVQITKMENSLQCLKGQISLIDDIVKPIILETVCILERELQELKEL